MCREVGPGHSGVLEGQTLKHKQQMGKRIFLKEYSALTRSFCDILDQVASKKLEHPVF